MILFKVWNLTNCKLKTNHIGHSGYLNCVTVSPDGSLCASGGKVRKYRLIYFKDNTVAEFQLLGRKLQCGSEQGINSNEVVASDYS